MPTLLVTSMVAVVTVWLEAQPVISAAESVASKNSTIWLSDFSEYEPRAGLPENTRPNSPSLLVIVVVFDVVKTEVPPAPPVQATLNVSPLKALRVLTELVALNSGQ